MGAFRGEQARSWRVSAGANGAVDQGKVVRARPGAVANGYPIGMLCAQWNIPFIPGDLNNATTFDYPVRYLEVEGLIGADILRGEGARYLSLVVDAAQQLEAEGVRAITSNCGFMGIFQEDVAAAVDVPVLLSSLLQLPTLVQLVGHTRRVGVLAANSAAVTPELLHAVGFDAPERIVVGGLEHYRHFRSVIFEETGRMRPAELLAEVLDAAQELQREAPDIGAILLECSDLPPYAAAITSVTGLPVFDWAAFIDHVHRAAFPHSYTGIY
jgi:hypothetical protein